MILKMEKTQKGFAPILIALILAVVLGGGYAWQRIRSSSYINSETSVKTQKQTEPKSSIQSPETGVSNGGAMTVEQIEQEKIKENLVASQNKQPIDMVSKPCTNNIKAEESSSVEYSSLVGRWTFEKAIISDFDCDGQKDVIIASYQSDPSQNWFKGNLQFFRKVNNSWKLINQNDFLGEPFEEIRSTKTSEGANAVLLTFKSPLKDRVVWIRNGYPTGI